MDTRTPQQRSPRLPPLPKPAAPSPPPPLSAAATPSHDLSFASPFRGHLLSLSMSNSPVAVGRVRSDLSHHSHARTSDRPQPTSGASSKDRDGDGAKNKASPFLSGLGGAWRKKESGGGGGDATVAGKAEVKWKARRALDVGQWVKRYMAAVVEQLRASFSSRQAEKEQPEQRRRRPHSFAGHGPDAAPEMRERERLRRRRGQLSSAPASLRVSPANSEHLSVGGSVNVSTSSEGSTMEELQSAIEAAIAHCKNSIGKDTSPRSQLGAVSRRARCKVEDRSSS